MAIRLTCLALSALCCATAAQATEAVYHCSDGRKVVAEFSGGTTSPGSVMLKFTDPQTDLTLPQVLSADGGRYADDQTEFWIKGKGATLTRNGNVMTCKTE